MTERPRFAITAATLPELPQAAAVKAAAWQESFDFPDSVFATQRKLVPQTVAQWSAALAEGGYVWQARDTRSGEAVGVAHACPDDGPTTLLLDTCYVLNVAKGTGLADALLNYAIGDAPAHLWVIETNLRARQFYAKHGFRPDGESKPLWDELAHLSAIRMVRYTESL